MAKPGWRAIDYGRKKLAFAYRPELAWDVFSSDQMQHLALLCDICDAAPLENFEDSRAADILSDAEIRVTG